MNYILLFVCLSSFKIQLFACHLTQNKLPAERKFVSNQGQLLPMSDFVIEQPTFDEIMETISPDDDKYQLPSAYTQSSLNGMANSHRGLRRSNLQINDNKDDSQLYASDNSINRHKQLRDRSVNQINVLDEDVDDVSENARDAFLHEQTFNEPQPLVNYLGAFGDTVYAQLKSSVILNSSSNNSSSSSSSSSLTQANINGQQTGVYSNSTSSIQQHQQLQLQLAIHELLDDFYYDQYINSKVLYYGQQLARAGETVEFGCFAPSDDNSLSWTKSSQALFDQTTTTTTTTTSATTSVIQAPGLRLETQQFGSARLNSSLKIFEVRESDSGNYRCSKASRKYHKLIVVPARANREQVRSAQQRLLAVVRPQLAVGVANNDYQDQRATQQQQQQKQTPTGAPNNTASGKQKSKHQQQHQHVFRNPLMPASYLIIERQPLIVNCQIPPNIQLALKYQPKFIITWLKNGKLLRAPILNSSNNLLRTQNNDNENNNNHHTSYNRLMQAATPNSGIAQQQQQQQQQIPRISLRLANGRQLYIASSQVSDAGDYICSWARLERKEADSSTSGGVSGQAIFADGRARSSTVTTGNDDEPSNPASQQQQATNLFEANEFYQFQLTTPVRLRQFKTSYTLRSGDELRLTCQLQGGFPSASVSWFIGNKLVDENYARMSNIQILNYQLNSASPQMFPNSSSSSSSLSSSSLSRQLTASASSSSADGQYESSSSNEASNDDKQTTADKNRPKLIVEINPNPATKQALASDRENTMRRHKTKPLSVERREAWIEYKKADEPRNALDTIEKKKAFARRKLDQVINPSNQATALSYNHQTASEVHSQQQTSLQASAINQQQQAAISVLIIPELVSSEHSTRISCRATNRVNTAEVTTILKLQETSTITVKPSNGLAIIEPGQPLYLECAVINDKQAQFKWWFKGFNSQSPYEVLLDPNSDENIEIHNQDLTIHKASFKYAGDYICRTIKPDKTEDPTEFAVIKLRPPVTIENFDLPSSQRTPKSALVSLGDRLEITCRVKDKASNVNITWFKSLTPDDNSKMLALSETPLPNQSQAHHQSGEYIPSQAANSGLLATYIAPSEPNIIIESHDKHTKKLIIESVAREDRSYYVCLAENDIKERARKVVFVRVRDNLAPLWPVLGIIAELVILFAVIYVWDTDKAYRELSNPERSSSKSSAQLQANDPSQQSAATTTPKRKPPIDIAIGSGI